MEAPFPTPNIQSKKKNSRAIGNTEKKCHEKSNKKLKKAIDVVQTKPQQIQQQCKISMQNLRMMESQMLALNEKEDQAV